MKLTKINHPSKKKKKLIQNENIEDENDDEIVGENQKSSEDSRTTVAEDSRHGKMELANNSHQTQEVSNYPEDSRVVKTSDERKEKGLKRLGTEKTRSPTVKKIKFEG